SNMFAVVVLDYLQEIAKEVLNDSVLAQNAHKLRTQINQGIQDYGTVEHPEFGTIYTYETDGLGNHEIGRASCREGVYKSGVDEKVKKNSRACKRGTCQTRCVLQSIRQQ